MEIPPDKVEYKGFIGEYTYDEEADLFEGSITSIEELVLFQGKSIKALTADFQEAIDDYLNWYNRMEKKPDKAS